MKASELIEAKQKGASFDRILHAVRTDRTTVSELTEDQLSFYESMLVELRKGLGDLESSLKGDDLVGMRSTARSLGEILQMIEDSCES